MAKLHDALACNETTFFHLSYQARGTLGLVEIQAN